jgi:hypothetical protein
MCCNPVADYIDQDSKGSKAKHMSETAGGALYVWMSSRYLQRALCTRVYMCSNSKF